MSIEIEDINTTIKENFEYLKDNNYEQEFIDNVYNNLVYLRKSFENIIEIPTDDDEIEPEKIRLLVTEQDIDEHTDKLNLYIKYLYGFRSKNDIIRDTDFDYFIKEKKELSKKFTEIITSNLEKYIKNDPGNFDNFMDELKKSLETLNIYYHAD